MAQDIYDELSVEGMKDFTAHRDSKYNFLYLCKNCMRSFDSKTAMDRCKFCGHQVVELRSIKRDKALKQGFRQNVMYRYYCPLCEKNFRTTEKLAMCGRCKTDYLHVYTWDTLGRRDKLQIKLNKSLKTVFARRERGKNAEEDSAPQNIVSKILKFTRRKEEMPTY